MSGSRVEVGVGVGVGVRVEVDVAFVEVDVDVTLVEVEVDVDVEVEVEVEVEDEVAFVEVVGWTGAGLKPSYCAMGFWKPATSPFILKYAFAGPIFGV